MRLDRKFRGLALGSALLCMVALSLVLFTAISAGISHLRMVDASTSQEHAQNLADAALAQAMSQMIASDFDFGKQPTHRVLVTIKGVEGTGVVTFDPDESGFADGRLFIVGASG